MAASAARRAELRLPYAQPPHGQRVLEHCDGDDVFVGTAELNSRVNSNLVSMGLVHPSFGGVPEAVPEDGSLFGIGNMHDIIEIDGDWIQMIYWPEEIVILPDQA